MHIDTLEGRLFHLKGQYAPIILERVLRIYGYNRVNGEDLDRKKLKAALYHTNTVNKVPHKRFELILTSEEINFILKN